MAFRILLVAFISISCVVAEVRRELTTRSWDAIGFSESVKRSPLEDTIIIGVVDTGIWPESPSFSDKGLGPPPAKWKGICQPNAFNFTCNNKIIGARFYVPDGVVGFNYSTYDEASPRDREGHGTHVAATAAGVPVPGISVKGVGLGTARGALPRARIAVYKTCWVSQDGGGCFFVDHAIDDAVKDGVDIITASIGGAFALPYSDDTTTIASFNAMRHGVFVSFAAGNSGPKRFLMDNVSPWVLTVANSHAGLEVGTPIKLGNGKTIKGQLLQKIGHKTLHPLVPSWEVSKVKNDSVLSMMCVPESLDPKLMEGKIILCPSLGGYYFTESTAAGFIYDAGFLYDALRQYHAPDEGRNTTYIAVNSEDFAYMIGYYNESASSSNGTATASILKTTEFMDREPPTIAYSSSRGPNLIDPTILKPDISAPGVNIIAAVDGNSTTGSYASYTGTSMATPHASGIAGFVKSFNPSWSPAAIKSALLTSASPMATTTTTDDGKNKEYELAYGAGMLYPLGAVDPGLVYNITTNDYIKYVCIWAKNNAFKVQTIIRHPNYNCSGIRLGKNNNWSLNLPTFSIPVKPNATFIQTFQRRVTNVGVPVSNYKSIIRAPKGVEIQLQPSFLSFTKFNQVLRFNVTIKGQLPDNETVLSGAFAWTDGRRQVRSPIVIYPEFDKEAEWKKLYEEAMKPSDSVGRSHIV